MLKPSVRERDDDQNKMDLDITEMKIKGKQNDLQTVKI
jgi:hypothetical protein